jgi:hypothetical protein
MPAYAMPMSSYGTPGYGGGSKDKDQGSYGGATSNVYSTSSLKDTGLSAAGYEDQEPLLRGLLNLKLSSVKTRASDIVNARAKMSEKEVQTLIQSVNANRKVYDNAERLSTRLQEGGLIHAGDRVIGYADGKVYVMGGSK